MTAEGILRADEDPQRPKAYLNYILFDEQMEIVSTFTGSFQANGNGAWQEIGTTAPMEIPANGYLAVYLSNQSRPTGCHVCGDVFFDKVKVRFSQGKLKEETHYYPFGLPMGNAGSTASNFLPNRRKYQSNEYIKDLSLNWMDFNFRQYDPQLGRFLSVDPLAASGGQDRLSPYAAMGNQPEFAVDPDGLEPKTFQYSGSIMAEPDNWANLEGRIAGLFKDSKSIFCSSGGGGGGTWDDQSFAEHMQNVAIFRIFKFIESLIAAGNGGGLFVSNFGDGGGGEENENGKDENGYSKNNTLYTTPNGEETHTVKEWADNYNGKTWNQITIENKGPDGDGYQRYLGGLIKFRLGPDEKWRYVKLDNGIVLDMRHVLVVGMSTTLGFKTGDIFGNLGENVQLLTDKNSARAKQDYLSNRVGESFLIYLEQNSPKYNPRHSSHQYGHYQETNISQYFLRFLTNVQFKGFK